MLTDVELTLNGKPVAGSVEARTHLADFIREDALATGTHIGCEQGVCGACTIFVDGEPTRSCITLAAACDTADVRTIEGFDGDPLMQALRNSFKQHHGLQCGYCTPGMLTTAYDIVRRLPNADRSRIRKELSGNLCRCTGYAGIVDAIEAVLRDPPPAGLLPGKKSKPRSAAPATAPIGSAPTGSAATPMVVHGDLPEEAALQNAPSLETTVSLNADSDSVWRIVAAPEEMVTCIPGAALSGPVADGLANGTCDVAIGPMKARFGGTVRIDYDAETRSGTILGSGRDAFTRSGLDGSLAFKLIPDGSKTDLMITMRYRLNGPLSQFGRPAIVREIANELLKQTATSVEAKLSGSPQATTQDAPRSIGGIGLLFGAFKSLIARVLSGR